MKCNKPGTERQDHEDLWIYSYLKAETLDLEEVESRTRMSRGGGDGAEERGWAVGALFQTQRMSKFWAAALRGEYIMHFR